MIKVLHPTEIKRVTEIFQDLVLSVMQILSTYIYIKRNCLRFNSSEPSYHDQKARLASVYLLTWSPFALVLPQVTLPFLEISQPAVYLGLLDDSIRPTDRAEENTKPAHRR